MLKSNDKTKSQEFETRPTLNTIINQSLKTMPICVSNVAEKDEKSQNKSKKSDK